MEEEYGRERHKKRDALYRGSSIQESFVLDILDYKRNGYYVELGAFHSTQGSNTYYLEKDFGWKGVSFEIEDDKRKEFNDNRSNYCAGDALGFNYIEYFEANDFPEQIDFLQVDIDHGYDFDCRPIGNHYTSLLGLISVPLCRYRFSIITFEHDESMYFRNAALKTCQREILDSLGYTLVHKEHYEDWWVDPNVIPADIYRRYFK